MRPPSREKLTAFKDYLATFDRKFALGQVITPGLFNRMLKDIADESEKALIMEAVLRSQTQAYYGPANAGHFGLALGSYAHFTSPIRRYADLLVHRALVDAFHLEQPQPKSGPLGKLPPSSGLSERDRAELGKISEAISGAERRAMEAERETIDRYMAAWLSGRVGEIFETRITGVQPFGFFATIIGLGGDGLVPVTTLGNDYFRYEEAARKLVGEQDRHQLCDGGPDQAQAGRGQPADRCAQIRAARCRRKSDRTARFEAAPAAQKWQIYRRAAWPPGQCPASGKEKTVSLLAQPGPSKGGP